MTRLIIFDIDSTLLTTRHVVSVFDRCFHLATGEVLEKKLRLAAMPELVIMQQLLECCGPSSAVTIEMLQSLYAQELRRMLELKPPIVLAGAHELLRAVADRGLELLFATGNSRSIAELKLESSGLGETLRTRGLTIRGAFGDRLTSKAEIVSSAVDEWTLATGWAPELAAIIGDSADDMAAGRRRGMHCVGVCTGASSKEELMMAGAAFVFDNLSDTRAVMRALVDDRPRSERVAQL